MRETKLKIKSPLSFAVNERRSFLGQKLVKDLKPIFKYQSAIDQMHYPINLPLRVSALIDEIDGAESCQRVVFIGAHEKDIFDDGKWFSVINSLCDSPMEVAFVGDQQTVHDSFKQSTFSFIANKLPYITKSIISLDEVNQHDLLIVVNTSPTDLKSILGNHKLKPHLVACLGSTFAEATLVCSILTNGIKHHFYPSALGISKKGSSYKYLYHGHCAYYSPDTPIQVSNRVSEIQNYYELLPYSMDAGIESTSRLLTIEDDGQVLSLSDFITVDRVLGQIQCSAHEVKWKRMLLAGELEEIEKSLKNTADHVKLVFAIMYESLLQITRAKEPENG